ncbi:hypothetical protein X975_02117, partial [Stegodyphus mimosarum]
MTSSMQPRKLGILPRNSSLNPPTPPMKTPYLTFNSKNRPGISKYVVWRLSMMSVNSASVRCSSTSCHKRSFRLRPGVDESTASPAPRLIRT